MPLHCLFKESPLAISNKNAKQKQDHMARILIEEGDVELTIHL
jgi:hypothetical protein